MFDLMLAEEWSQPSLYIFNKRDKTQSFDHYILNFIGRKIVLHTNTMIKYANILQ